MLGANLGLLLYGEVSVIDSEDIQFQRRSGTTRIVKVRCFFLNIACFRLGERGYTMTFLYKVSFNRGVRLNKCANSKNM